MRFMIWLRRKIRLLSFKVISYRYCVNSYSGLTAIVIKGTIFVPPICKIYILINSNYVRSHSDIFNASHTRRESLNNPFWQLKEF